MNTKKLDVIRKKPEQKRSRKRLNDVMDATKSLIVELGVDPITMTDVARKADMKVTALYRYFPNKPALLRELAIRMFENDHENIANAVFTSEQDIEKTLKRAMLDYWQLHIEEPYRLGLQMAIQSDDYLFDIDLEDTRLNAGFLAQQISEATSRNEIQIFEQRMIMVFSLLSTVIRLTTFLDVKEAASIKNDFIEMSITHILK